MLLPKGNYAARCCHDGRGWLLFNFFSIGSPDDGRKNFLPPPKRLDVNAQGRLCLRSYEHFDNLELYPAERADPQQYRRVVGNPYGRVEMIDDGVQLSCQSGYEAFVVNAKQKDFRLRCRIQLPRQYYLETKRGILQRRDERWSMATASSISDRRGEGAQFRSQSQATLRRGIPLRQTEPPLLPR